MKRADNGYIPSAGKSHRGPTRQTERNQPTGHGRGVFHLSQIMEVLARVR